MELRRLSDARGFPRKCCSLASLSIVAKRWKTHLKGSILTGDLLTSVIHQPVNLEEWVMQMQEGLLGASPALPCSDGEAS